MFDGSLQLCGDKHPGFSCLDEGQQHLVFFGLPWLTWLPGHYGFFAFSPISTIPAIYFALEDAAGASAVISNLAAERNATAKIKPTATA
jgi:hypothetical protein